MRHRSLALGSLLWIAFHCPAAALPVNIVDQGSTTHDALTNRDWLDLTETSGLSLPEVTTQFLSAGWQIASQADVDAFAGNAGVANGFSSPPDANLLALQGLLGVTSLSEDPVVSYGWTSDLNALDPSFRLVVFLRHDIADDSTQYSAFLSSDPVNSGDLIIGWWLYQSHAVPEPSSIALLLGGGAMLLALRRRITRAH